MNKLLKLVEMVEENDFLLVVFVLNGRYRLGDAVNRFNFLQLKKMGKIYVNGYGIIFNLS